MLNRKYAPLLLVICLLSVSATAFPVARLSAELARQVLDAVQAKMSIEKILDQDRFEFFLPEEKELLRNMAKSVNVKLSKGLFEGKAITPLYKTQNGLGVELQYDTPFQSELRNRIKPHMRVLDVGSAYGYNTRIALELGANVVALDMEPSHLAVLVRNTPRELLPQLSIELGSYPYHISDEEAEVYDAIIAGQVFHFLQPNQLKSAYMKSHRLLKHGGTMLIMQNTTNSHFLVKLKPIMDHRVRVASLLVGFGYDGMIFPTYPRDFVEQNEENCRYLHTFDTAMTIHNLKRAGFSYVTDGQFSTMYNESNYRVLENDPNGIYAYIVTTKN